MISGLVSAVCSFVLFLIGHVLLFQLFTITRRFQALVATWFVLLVAYLMIYLFMERHFPAVPASSSPSSSYEGLVGFVNGIVVYLLFFLIYCCLYFTDHSLSIAFMIELEDRPQKKMTRNELTQRFPFDAFLKQRITDLEESKFIIREGDYIRVAPKGKLCAATLGSLKRFLKLEPGG